MIQLLDREGTRLSLSHRVDTCTIPRFMSKERGKECQAGSQYFWEKSLIFFLRVLAVGSGEKQGTQSEDTTKLMFRSNLLFILSLSFTTLACIRVASFLFFLSFLPPFLPPFSLSSLFLLSSIEHKSTEGYNLFSIILSLDHQIHTQFLPAFYDHEFLSPSSSLHLPSFCMKPFRNTSAPSDLSFYQQFFFFLFLTIPEAACQFMWNLVWENGSLWTLKASQN